MKFIFLAICIFIFACNKKVDYENDLTIPNILKEENAKQSK